MRVGLDDGRRSIRCMRREAPPGRSVPLLGGRLPLSKRLGPTGRVPGAGFVLGCAGIGPPWLDLGEAGAGAGADD